VKKFWPSLLSGSGVLLLIIGVIYDVIFAGIPYQDPTPEMSARYAFHSYIASIFYWIGGGAFLFGVVAACIRFLRRHFQSSEVS
jgi:hypothetical protein